MAKDIKQVSARIPRDLYVELKVRAARTGKTMNEIITESLQKWLEKEDRGHTDEIQGS
jgi:predicted DNA-binding protein